MSMIDSRKYKAYIELIIATVCITILYLILRDFRLSELLPIDEGKAMDRFIADFIVSGTETDRGFFAVCQYNVQNMVIYLFSRITGNRIIGVNIYYILTFFAISFSSYWLLTKVGVSHAVSVFGAILLSVLPYHTDRGVMQVITSGFFMVPVIMGIFYDIYFAEKYQKEEQRINRIYVVVLLMLPWIDINLTFMTAILMVMLCLQKHRKDTTYLSAVYGLPMLIEALVIYNIAHMGTKTNLTEAVEKAKEEGLRILDFIMPVRRHIYDRFFNLRYDYDIAFGANGESGLNTLGFLLSVCFVMGILVLLFGKKGNPLVKWLSWMNIVVILFANISGFGLLVEYVGIHVTFWNRMGIFIIVSSAVIMGIYADQIKTILQNKANKVICNITFVFVAIVAILDVLLRHAPV